MIQEKNIQNTSWIFWLSVVFRYRTKLHSFLLDMSSVLLRTNRTIDFERFIEYRETTTRYFMVTWRDSIGFNRLCGNCSWNYVVYILNCRPVYPRSSLDRAILLIETRVSKREWLNLSRYSQIFPANVSKKVANHALMIEAQS